MISTFSGKMLIRVRAKWLGLHGIKMNIGINIHKFASFDIQDLIAIEVMNGERVGNNGDINMDSENRQVSAEVDVRDVYHRQMSGSGVSSLVSKYHYVHLFTCVNDYYSYYHYYPILFFMNSID